MLKEDQSVSGLLTSPPIIGVIPLACLFSRSNYSLVDDRYELSTFLGRGGGGGGGGGGGDDSMLQWLVSSVLQV